MLVKEDDIMNYDIDELLDRFAKDEYDSTIQYAINNFKKEVAIKMILENISDDVIIRCLNINKKVLLEIKNLIKSIIGNDFN